MNTYIVEEEKVERTDRRWSMSTTTTAAQTPTDDDNPGPSAWSPPPVPHIADPDSGMAAWQRRSLKRDSYTSQTMQLKPALAAAIRQNHRASVGATWPGDFRPKSTYRPRASRVNLVHQRVITGNETSWASDSSNPQNWSRSSKALHTFAALFATFSVAVSSSALSSVVISNEMSTITTLLPSAIFIAGLAFVPLTGPLRTIFGCRSIVGSSLLLTLVFTLVSAFVDSFAAQLTLRFLAGLAASPILATAPVMLTEIHPAGRRTFPFLLYVVVLAGGTSIGFFIGSVTTYTASPTWSYYAVLIPLAISLSTLYLVKETSKEAIIRARLGAGRPTLCVCKLSWSATSCVQMLATQSSVILAASCIGAYAMISFGLLHAVPFMYRITYSYGTALQGAIVLGLGCGQVTALICFACFHGLSYVPRRRAWEDQLAAEMEAALIAAPRQNSQRRRGPRTKRKSNHSHQRSTSIVSSGTPKPTQEPKDDASEPLVQMTTGLAVAMSHELNADLLNDGRHISPNRLWMAARDSPTFDQLLDKLNTEFDLAINRKQMLKLKDAWTGLQTDVMHTGDARSPLEPSQAVQIPENTADVYRAATLAALEKIPSATHTSEKDPSSRRHHSRLPPLTHISQQRPPARWRLPLALPAAVIATAGLFVFAWTCNAQVHWVMPTIGLAVFAFGGLLCSICVCLYLTDKFGAGDLVLALTSISAVSYLSSFAMSMATVPMYEGLGIGWATSVLGFCSVLPWLAPLALQYWSG